MRRTIVLVSTLALMGSAAVAQPTSVLLPKTLPFPESLSVAADGTVSEGQLDLIPKTPDSTATLPSFDLRAVALPQS